MVSIRKTLCKVGMLVEAGCFPRKEKIQCYSVTFEIIFRAWIYPFEIRTDPLRTQIGTQMRGIVFKVDIWPDQAHNPETLRDNVMRSETNQLGLVG